MSKRLIFFCIASLLCLSLCAQHSKTGIGTGINFQYGLNPSSEYFKWNIENEGHNLVPVSRFFVGPSIRFRNFKKWQVEGSLQYSRTNFRVLENDNTNLQDILVNEWQLPISLNYNAAPPLKRHSALVYQGGLLFKNQFIPSQGKIVNNYSFFTPAVFLGVRLATELSTIGMIEYGITYSRNLNDSHILYAENQDSAPSLIEYNQTGGQWRFMLVYYFSPRKHTWSKERYRLDY